MSDISKELAIPEPLDSYLQNKYGSVRAIEKLTGRSNGQVLRLNLQRKSIVVKKVTNEREIYFYELIAPRLNERGASTAKLEWSGLDRNLPWIAIEYIPFTLPETRWEADKGVTDYLAKVHSYKKAEVKINKPFIPEWTEEMTLTALDCFDPYEHEELKTQLEELRLSSNHLFQPMCLICGDPNPKNWGIRLDDSLVQYDWHKIGYGTPAIDLAISICSSENKETANAAAEHYVQSQASHFDFTKDQLSNDILKGVVWNYIQFLSNYMNGEIAVPEKLIEHIIEMFPKWLKDTPIKLD